jgi:hypothetical protein
LVLQELQEIKAGKIAERAITDLAVLGCRINTIGIENRNRKQRESTPIVLMVIK